MIPKFLAIILFLSTCSSQAAYAQPETSFGGGTGGWCMPGGIKGHGIAQSLERSGVVLTDDQVEKMTSLRRDLMGSLAPRKDHVMALAGDLKETLSATKIDDDQAKKIFANIKTEIDESYAKMVEHLIAVAHIFTPEQRQKLKVAFDRSSLGPLGGTAPPQDGKKP